MITSIESLLNAQQLEAANDLLDKEQYLPGVATAGEMAAAVKDNLELSRDGSSCEAIDNLVMGALVNHPLYLNSSLPAKVAAPHYVKYSRGMAYGWHTDDPLMGGPAGRYRCDIAVTIWLNDRDDYDGGELEVESPWGIQVFRGAAGEALLYPANSRHRVTPVVRGERRVAVTWIQSMVASHEQRALLWELYQAREGLRRKDPKCRETALVHSSYVNLVRLWGTP